MSEFKDFLYLSSDQLNEAKGVFSTFCYILHNGQSKITCEWIENNYYM